MDWLFLWLLYSCSNWSEISWAKVLSKIFVFGKGFFEPDVLPDAYWILMLFSARRGRASLLIVGRLLLCSFWLFFGESIWLEWRLKPARDRVLTPAQGSEVVGIVFRFVRAKEHCKAFLFWINFRGCFLAAFVMFVGRGIVIPEEKYGMSGGGVEEGMIGYWSTVDRRAAVIRAISFFLSWHFQL